MKSRFIYFELRTRNSIRAFVLLSVRQSVGVHELKSVKTRISTPAQPSATGMAVYMTLFHF